MVPAPSRRRMHGSSPNRILRSIPRTRRRRRPRVRADGTIDVVTDAQMLAIEIIRRTDRDERLDDRKLRKLIAAGTWTRVAPGAFARAAEWRTLDPLEQHRARVQEVARRMRRPAVLSHFAAAAIHGMDVLGHWPRLVDVTVPRSSGGRSSGDIRRHTRGLGDPETLDWGIHRVTTPAQTALDLARILPFVEGVAVIDQAIRLERPGGSLTTRSEIEGLWDLGHRHRGNPRALRAILFANPLAANVRESQSRVVLARLGFPTPRLQERRVLRSGRLVFGDFYFSDYDHWAELDGRGKYRSPQFGTDREPAEIVIDEKNRENEIRREVRGFSRWEPADADRPRYLYDLLTADGLPSSLPRP